MRQIVLAVSFALLLTGRATALPQSPDPAPVGKGVRELRLGVICYGGISLAVYMYGTTREIHHLLLASDALELDARANPSVQPGEIGDRGAMLSTSARHYYRLLSDKWKRDGVRTRVVVDIISGTSAGGINGIILAKAIATNKPIDDLRTLWFKEADIVKLAGGRPWHLKAVWRLLRKRPVLTGDRWLRQLYEAFKKMDGGDVSSPSQSLLPAGSQLDLLVTSTNYYGSSRMVEVGDPATSADTYHNQVFHFEFPDKQAEEHSFTGPAGNATLAFAGRSSASFPVAFPPMNITNLLEVIPEAGSDGAALARKVFGHQLLDSGDCPPEKDCAKAFAEGLFLVDGGALDNYPLGIAFQRTSRTMPSVPAQRVFLYLEPDPSSPPAGNTAMDREAPNSWQIIWGASAAIPGNEPIAEDFRQLARHNERVDRILDVLARNEQQAVLEQQDPAPDPGAPALAGQQSVQGLLGLASKPEEVTVATLVENAVDYKLADDTLKEIRQETDPATPTLLEQKAVATQRQAIEDDAAASQPVMEEAYVRLRVHSVLDQLARTPGTRVCNLPEDYVGPRASLARAIVFQWAEASGLKKALSGDLPPSLLDNESLARERRKEFLTAFDLGYLRRNLRFVLAWIDSQYPGGEPTYSYGLTPEQLQSAHDAVTKQIREVSKLVQGLDIDQLTGGGTAREGLRGALCVPPDPKKTIGEQAAEVIAKHRGTIDAFRSLLAPSLLKNQDRIRAELFKEFVAQTEAWNKPEARRAVLARYLGFPYWDRVAYPYTAFSGTGELAHANVVRLSPQDAISLSRNGAERLAGSRLFHFGAFLDPEGRESDYVWGRFDGAERLSKLLGAGSVPDSFYPAILDEEEGAVSAGVLARLRRCVEHQPDACKAPPKKHRGR
ncbi:MAG: hypothetical protein QOH06_1082 [Acidobacteriota bacterium]|jgi:predicted acylesterase/phospholipase RssA|nr:hypothetical protein [Acidobacteriota bacterium]